MNPPSSLLMRPHVRLGLAVALFLVHAAWLACVAEDSFISFRFSHHLASGHGLVWNLGEAPVEGFTNLLWVLLGAAVEGLGLDMVTVLPLLGVAAGVATLWLADRFADRVLGLSGAARALPALLLAVSGPFATWAASGLETPLFAFLALAAFYALARHERTGGNRNLVLGWLAVALATLTRPEGVLLAGVAAGLSLFNPERRKAAAFALAAYAGFLLWLTAFRILYFGQPLPNTFYAKTGGGLLQALRGAQYGGFFAFHFLLPLLPLALLGLASRNRGGEIRRGAPLALAAWAAGYSLYIVAVGGDYMAMDRFFVPILPALYLLVGLAASPLLKREPVPSLRPVALALAGLAVAGTLVQSTPLEARLFAKPPLQHGTYRGVETERWHVARLELLARFFAERGREPENAGLAPRLAPSLAPSLATGAIGVIGYRVPFAVYDFHGLTDPRIAHGGRGRRPIGSGLPGHEKEDFGAVLDHRPTYWMFSRRLRSEPEDWPRYDEKTDRRLHRQYRLVSVWLRDEVNREEGNFTFLERRPETPPPSERGGPAPDGPAPDGPAPDGPAPEGAAPEESGAPDG